jgi:hypothetical protein
MDDIYNLVPLDDGVSTNIRVIEILDDDTEDSRGPICCKFHRISLDDSPDYTALSYTWGSLDNTRTIELNGKPFTVRENLWEFLDEARRRGQVRPHRFWIDAICINQSRISKRNHQVSIMGAIYSHAAHVLVWLGAKTPATALRMWNSSLLSSSLDPENRRVYYGDPQFQAQETALRELCERSYWSRLWILQEFVLAREIGIWCGNETASYDSLHHLLMEFHSLRYTPAAKILYSRRVRGYSSHRMSVEELLDEFRDMECMDVRDRVYALLSLLDPKERKLMDIEPDYSISPSGLFEKVFTGLCGEFMEPVYEEDLLTLRKALGLNEEDDVVQRVLRSEKANPGARYYSGIVNGQRF